MTAEPIDRLRGSNERNIERLRIADGIIADLEAERNRLRKIEAAGRHLEANCDRINPDPLVLATCRTMLRQCLELDEETGQ